MNLKKGNIFKYENEIYKVIEEPAITKPGKGGAFVQIVAHNIHNKRKVNIKFRTEDRVEHVSIFINREVYLYDDGNTAYFTNNIEYDLKNIELYQFLTNNNDDEMDEYLNRNPNSPDNKIVEISSYEDNIIEIKLLNEVVGKIISNNGSEIKVCPLNDDYKNFEYTIKGPGFLQVRENIIFNKDTNEFIRRLNSYNK